MTYLSGHGQEKSVLYNLDQQLLADTTLSINDKQFKIWKNVEYRVLTKFINCYNAPPILVDAGITFSLIVSFNYNKQDKVFNNLKIEKHLDKYSENLMSQRMLANAIIEPIRDCLNMGADYSIVTSMKENKDEYKYYVPISLDFDKIEEYVLPNGSIKLKTPSPAPLKIDHVIVH